MSVEEFLTMYKWLFKKPQITPEELAYSENETYSV